MGKQAKVDRNIVEYENIWYVRKKWTDSWVTTSETIRSRSFV